MTADLSFRDSREHFVKLPSKRISVLVWIKLVHTAIWLFFAGCIVAIPLAGARRQFLWAIALSGLVLVECAVLAVNRGRCPLTDLAGRYTDLPTAIRATVVSEVEVQVKVQVDESGRVVRVDLVGSTGPVSGSLVSVTQEAALQWRFAPAVRDSQPVASEVVLMFRYIPKMAGPK
jgi:TonB-like protein